MAFGETPVGFGVDPADEERRHRRDARDVAALLGVTLEAAEVRLDDLRVPDEREDQRDVDRDALGQALLDGGDPCQGRRDLHEDVGARRLTVQPVDLVDGGGGLVGAIGRDLHRHESVGAVQLVIGGAEHVGGVADVVEDEGPVGGVDGGAGAGELDELLVVAFPGGHGLLEDRRVRGDAPDAVVVHHAGEPAPGDELPGEVVVPGALPVVDEAGDGGACRSHRALPPVDSRASRARARATTFSGVYPNSASATLPGADAPKWSMAMTSSA